MQLLQIMKYIVSLFCLIIIVSTSSGQEVLTGLKYNPVIKQELKKMAAQGLGIMRSRDNGPSNNMPFFDDFHQVEIYPAEERWASNDTYINADFAYHSANVGAATFDAIDASGNLFPEASTFPFIADYLVSNLIRLDSIFNPAAKAITVADSIYFSFYYQPQGRGNAPEAWDSLVLQFGVYSGDSVFGYVDSILIPLDEYIFPGEVIYPFDTLFAPPECDSGLYIVATDTLYYDDTISMPCDTILVPETNWYTIWSSEGMKLDSFYSKYNTYSRQLLIPVTDSARYYKNSFQFRFFNYASLSSNNVPSWRSNTDHWNVDYVYLNINRSASDSTYRKITFAERALSLLKRYESMPYNQYKNDPTNEMNDSTYVLITNLDDEAYNTDYWYKVDEIDGTFNYFYDGGGCNLPPFYEFGYQRCDATCGAAHACPPVNFIYSLGFGKDSALFHIEHRINGFTAADTIGDTIQFLQKFYNYYAYDDGTPEAGYGVNTIFGRVAYRFKLNIKDTLRAVRMYFNRTQNDANDNLFTLLVWRDNDGEPGETIYEQANLRPGFTNDLYRMSTYYLDEPVPVTSVFYIGWIQSTADNLNIGWDAFKDASSNIYYNVTGQWQKTAYTGSMLMRPVLGEEFDPTGLPENTEEESQLMLFPNPNRDGTLHIRVSGMTDDLKYPSSELMIYNMYGQLVFHQGFSQEIDISDLANGVYIIRFHNPSSGKTISGKFMINH